MNKRSKMMTVNSRHLLLMTIGILVASFTVQAATVRLSYKNAEANSLLYGEGESGTLTDWQSAYTDGRNPHAGADYILGWYEGTTFMKSGRCCLGTSAHPSFLGDSLSIGDIATDSTFALHQRRGGVQDGSVSILYRKLILAKGSYFFQPAGEPFVTLTGAIEVQSPASSPFSLYLDETTAALYRWRMAAPISGANGTALKFYNTNPDTASIEYVIEGDNGDYHGKFLATAGGTYLLFSDSASLGAGEALSDAISLSNGAGIGGAPGKKSVLASQRGVVVETTGGSLYAPKLSTVVLQLPITGQGPVRVCGGGMVVLNGVYAAGDITVAADTLFEVGKDAVVDPNVRIVYESGHKEQISLPENGAEGQLDFASHDGATLIFSCNATTASGCFEVTSDCHTWPVRFLIKDDFVRPSPGMRYTLLKIPTSIRTVSKKDFFVTGSAPRCSTLSVEANDGMQCVIIEFPKVLTGTGEGFQWGGGQKPDFWTDGNTNYRYGFDTTRESQTYDPNVAYLTTIGNQTQRMLPPSPFCGDGYRHSLSLAPSSRNVTGYSWKGEDERIIADLRLYNNAYLFPNYRDMIIGGAMSVFAAEESPAEFLAANNSTKKAILSADLSGDGCLRVGSADQAESDNAYIGFTGDNSRYLGKLIHDTRNGSRNSVLEIADGNALGGNPALFVADAVCLAGAGNTLKVATDVDLANVNRGITVGDGYVFDVASGKRMSVKSRMTLSGVITKTGAGTLELDDIAVDGTARIVIKGGSFLHNCNLPEGLSVIADGGKVGNYPFPAAGETVALPTGAALPGAYFEFIASAATGCYQISAEHCPTTWPIGISYTLGSRPSPNVKYPIFRIPTSVRIVSKWDFFGLGTTPQFEDYSVETVGDMQIVSVEFPDYMEARDINYDVETWIVHGQEGNIDVAHKTYPSWWKVEDWPNYANYALSVNKDGYRWNGYWCSKTGYAEFPGKSMSVRGYGAGNTTRYYIIGKMADLTIADMRWYEYVIFRRNGATGSVNGHLLIAGTESAPSQIGLEDAGYALTLNSELRGNGTLQVFGGDAVRAKYAKGTVLELAGDNSRFIGTLDIRNVNGYPCAAGQENDVTVKVSNDNAFGGNPAMFNSKAVRLSGANAIHIIDNVKMSAANRGFYFANEPIVSVDANCEFEIGSLATFAGVVTKKGYGSLSLMAARPETETPGENILAVEGGTVDLLDPSAVQNVKFTIASDANLIVRLSRRSIGTDGLVNVIDDAPFGSTGPITVAWAEGEGLDPYVKALKKASIPLLTVKTSASAGIANRIVLPPRGGTYSLRLETKGDLTTVFVDAKTSLGLVISVK